MWVQVKRSWGCEVQLVSVDGTVCMAGRKAVGRLSCPSSCHGVQAAPLCAPRVAAALLQMPRRAACSPLPASHSQPARAVHCDRSRAAGPHTAAAVGRAPPCAGALQCGALGPWGSSKPPPGAEQTAVPQGLPACCAAALVLLAGVSCNCHEPCGGLPSAPPDVIHTPAPARPLSNSASAG